MQKNSFRVEPFDPEYFAGKTGIQGWVAFDGADEFKTYLEGLARNPAYCAFYGDEVVGAAGVIIPYRGVGEAWAMVLPGARQCARQFQKAVKRGLRRIIAEHGLHRVEASVLENFTAGRAWAVALGFKPESVRRCAGPNKENLIMFAMFPGGE